MVDTSDSDAEIPLQPSRPLRRLRCPRCAYEADEDKFPHIRVFLQDYAGTYCQRCWVAWLADHIPQAQVVRASGDSEQ